MRFYRSLGGEALGRLQSGGLRKRGGGKGTEAMADRGAQGAGGESHELKVGVWEVRPAPG
jgi:hypothetical protein